MSTSSAVIGATVPAFGGKRTLAPIIVEELGEHHAYWEPFCMSLAVLLAKPPSRAETVNDLHQDATNLARVIQHKTDGPWFYRKLRRMFVCEGLFKDAVKAVSQPYAGEYDPVRAYHYFVVSWLGRNGMAGTENIRHSFCVRYTNNGGTPAKRWVSATESVMSWHQRLREVTILTRDAFEVIGKIEDSKGTVIYADPPYIKKAGKYKHDFANGIKDHERLAELLRRFQSTRVVLSYYADPALLALYPGWRVREVAAGKQMSQATKRVAKGRTEAAEVLLVNDGGGGKTNGQPSGPRHEGNGHAGGLFE